MISSRVGRGTGHPGVVVKLLPLFRGIFTKGVPMRLNEEVLGDEVFAYFDGARYWVIWDAVEADFWHLSLYWGHC